VSRLGLILDDDPGIRKLLGSFLKLEGVTALESSCCKDALEKCASNKMDIVILDCNIGDNELGWDVAVKLRADKTLYGEPKIIAISGTVDFGQMDDENSPENSVDLLLQKPFDIKTIRTHIRDLLGSQ